jgi:rRNA processing protein Gar1
MPVATFSHACEGEMIAMIDGERVPLLARMIYNENKTLIGKVDDVFGPMHTPGICVKTDANSGVKAESFKKGDKVSVHSLFSFSIYNDLW